MQALNPLDQYIVTTIHSALPYAWDNSFERFHNFIDERIRWRISVQINAENGQRHLRVEFLQGFAPSDISTIMQALKNDGLRTEPVRQSDGPMAIMVWR